MYVTGCDDDGYAVMGDNGFHCLAVYQWALVLSIAVCGAWVGKRSTIPTPAANAEGRAIVMKDQAESRLLHERSGDRKLENAFQRMKLAPSIWPTTLAAVIALISCLAFSIFFQRALSGFSKQVNGFISVGDFSSIFLQTIVFIISAVVIIYLLFTYLASARVFSNILGVCGSPCLLFLSSFSSQGFLIIWVLLLCLVSAVTLVHLIAVYFLFIGGILSFCALVDQQCFDFRVLIPAIVSRFSNKKVDMTFCAEKKELLCSQQNNQIWNFVLAFIFGLVTLAAMLFLQNCVVYGLGKRQASKEQRTRERNDLKERYEMKTLRWERILMLLHVTVPLLLLWD
ncbi:hypothetical protein OESDEN_00116 [Oesophagostomum dentatum]|uniref:Uncharacterized protein n=1 Tax=Oesophagostomum dentatum TaxID=61180 RepID=A0A0B1TUV6_OESDE|nr:hypothetical protein OESDEN_00116 [Oesophagostomum dentatum]